MTARTYVVGLPVVITVSDDGTVTAEVDLCEADYAPSESSGVHHERVDGEWVDVAGPDEDTIIADKERISAAVVAGTVTVS